ncbi:MAG TPA: excinuclease ABC subunit UvrB [Caldithrix abyssi]|uniref:UvrABC system protein B n=1 Tax=Caldithrix abyssi TaxID=187145 RepID=A0A7V1LKV0_CALAY|nr:excinuclease ABC subunit UvrB [Caldithrix abyssi]
MSDFKLVSGYTPQGDQPAAIEQLVQGLESKIPFQTLMGVTGSGKTFTMANVIARVNRPTLILSHNKTLAAQLYAEFKQFFPENAVEFFISYYDYYQPEAYIPTTDTFIEKDSSINDEIDRLRLRATSSLLSRRDVIVVASVSCIYGIGNPSDYQDMLVFFKTGQVINRQDFLMKLVDIQYTRNDFDFQRGTFRVRGDVIDLFPAYEEFAYRLEFFGNEIDRISIIDPLTGKSRQAVDRAAIFPAKHFVTTAEKMERARAEIRRELDQQLQKFRAQGKLLEAQRIEMRTNFDLEMMEEIGYCSGIENYSRFLSGREPGQPPYTLLDFFPDDYLLFVDESHQSFPQIRAMYNGDRSRKEVLVEYGFRLPSALDNRPLKFEEFRQHMGQTIAVSATPADFELEQSGGVVVEQVIRPTGLVDPLIEVRPIATQIDDLIEEVRGCVERGERALITTLTKRMSEDLADYLNAAGIRVRYIHSEIDSLERVGILRELRLAEFDALVGINLLREGLDLPEVTLVAILDADKEGFLRSYVSLMQTAGRAARNIGGKVIFYADRITDSMKRTMEESRRRREKQMAWNKAHNITPESVMKTTEEIMRSTAVADVLKNPGRVAEVQVSYNAGLSNEELISRLEKDMRAAAMNLEFEKAAVLRDEIKRIKEESERQK